MNTYSNALVQTLQEEVGRLIDIERVAADPEAKIVRAQINFRIIAVELLEFADQAGPEGSHAALVGVRLFDARTGFDEALHSIGDFAAKDDDDAALAGDADARAMAASIERFNRVTSERIESVRTTELAAFDRAVGGAFAPLAGAVAQFGPIANLSHWVSEDEVRGAPSAHVAGSPDGDRTVEHLAACVEEVPLSEQAQDDLRTVIEFIGRGEAFSELSARVESLRLTVQSLLDMAALLPEFEPLGTQAVTRCGGHLEVIAALIRDPDRRESGVQRLPRVRDLFERMQILAELRRARVDVTPLVDLSLAADRMLDERDRRPAGETIIARIDQIAADILAHRGLPDVEMPRELRELRVQYRQLDRRCRETERALLERLPELIDRPDALADPAFSSTFVEHRQLLDDLRRLQRIPEWMETVEQYNADSSRRVARQVHKMVNWLVDSNRRPEATRAMDMFEQQFALAANMPFEEDLKQPTPEAVTFSGGRHEQLLEAIAATRNEWCAAWVEGNATSAAAQRLYQINRLLGAMADAAQLTRMGGDASLLNRWAAWEFPRGLAQRPVSETTNRFKLATAAIIEGDGSALASQIEGIERDAPLVMLVGRIGHWIEQPLRVRADGALGALVQCAHPPDDDAWMIRRRRDLANLCRYAAELEHARRQGADALAEELEQYVHAVANDLLQQLGQPRLDVQPLIGFDGSDPVPEFD